MGETFQEKINQSVDRNAFLIQMCGVLIVYPILHFVEFAIFHNLNYSVIKSGIVLALRRYQTFDLEWSANGDMVC